MEKHITAIGVIHIAFGALELFGAVVVLLVFTGLGAASGNHEGFIFMSGLGTVISFFLAASALPSIIGGIGVLKHQNWGRILVLIVSFLKLMSIPLGTAIGIYSIIFLLKPEAAALFEKKTAAIA